MNPVAFVLIFVGVFLVISGFRGHSDNIISAVTGTNYGGASLK